MRKGAELVAWIILCWEKWEIAWTNRLYDWIFSVDIRVKTKFFRMFAWNKMDSEISKTVLLIVYRVSKCDRS